MVNKYAEEAAVLRASRNRCAFLGIFFAALMTAFVAHVIKTADDPALLNAITTIPSTAEEAAAFGSVLFLFVFLGGVSFFAPWGFYAFFSALDGKFNGFIHWVLILVLMSFAISFSFGCGWMCFLYQCWKIRKADKASQG